MCGETIKLKQNSTELLKTSFINWSTQLSHPYWTRTPFVSQYLFLLDVDKKIRKMMLHLYEKASPTDLDAHFKLLFAGLSIASY